VSKQRTEISWWSIIGNLAYPWASLAVVWQFGLHFAVLVTGVGFIAAALIAAGIVLGESRRDAA